MKILFSLPDSGYVEKYQAVIIYLVENGHDVHIICSHKNKHRDPLLVKLAQLYSEFTFAVCCIDKNAFWYSVAEKIRSCYDYLRYFGKAYGKSSRLRQRAGQKVPEILRFVLEKIVVRKSESRMWSTIRWLRRLEQCIPADRHISSILQQQQPALVVITPLIKLGDSQIEWLKCAQKLGIQSGFCVDDWDHLINQGAIQIKPDFIIVWNEWQQRQIEEFHKISSNKVIITGAPCFDAWLTQKPATSYEQFCEKIQLNENRSFLLYLCSSRFAAPNEVGFIKKWIKQIRNHSNEDVSTLGILIRPHPQNLAQWKNVTFSDMENVSIYPFPNLMTEIRLQVADFFDSVFHCTGIVGINTGAMIEAGVLNKAVFTILDPKFKDTQLAKLHFCSLPQGLLQIGENFSQHLQQLQNMDNFKEQRQKLIQQFVRPHGIDVACAPIMAKALVSNISQSKPYSGFVWWFYPLKLLALFLALSVWCLRLSKHSYALCRNLLRAITFIPLQILQLRTLLQSITSWKIQITSMPLVRNRFLPWLQRQTMSPKYMTTKHKHLERLHKGLRKASHLSLPESLGQLDVLAELEQIASKSNPIVVGPWLSEVGFELLYWIPFVRWASEYYSLHNRRMVIVSRGGTRAWYDGLVNDYVDIFSCFSPQEFKKLNEQRIAEAGHQKHMKISSFDKKIIRSMQEILQLEDFSLFHPWLMYRLFHPCWGRQYPVNFIDNYTHYTRLTPAPTKKIVDKLPANYVATKFYFRLSFADTDENQSFAHAALKSLAAKTHVIILNTGFRVDDHMDFAPELCDRIHTIDDFVQPQDNLSIQTQIISNASLFMGTYGGFSYLAPFYGIPSISFYANEDFNRIHLDLADRIFSTLKHRHRMDESYDPKFLVLKNRNLTFLQQILPEEKL